MMNEIQPNTPFEKFPRKIQGKYYVRNFFRKEGDNDSDTYGRLYEVLEKRIPIVIVESPGIAGSVDKWITAGERLKLLATDTCLSSLILSSTPLKLHREALALATGGLAMQVMHSCIWGRGPLSRYVVQPVKHWPINEKAVLSKTTVLVRKPKTGSYLVRAALAVTAVSVSAYLFWKSM